LSSDKQISEEESCEAEALLAAEVFEERRQIPG
jgi:hypothetical protein